MTHYVGLDVSQKVTAICVVDETGRRLWRGQCSSDPEQIERTVRRHGGDELCIGVETGPMTALMGWTPPDGIGVPKWRCR